jgi:hypothetical protein
VAVTAISGKEASIQKDTKDAAMTVAIGAPNANHIAAAIPMLPKATKADGRCSIRVSLLSLRRVARFL